MIKSILKSVIPDTTWNTARTDYNRLRYRYLWMRRQVLSVERQGVTTKFVILDKSDPIQSVQASGHFYEEDELVTISSFFKRGGHFVDIGANTGQHSIYFAKFFDATATLFEPVPETCQILTENVRLNELQNRFDLSYLGYGLSDRDQRVSIKMNTHNLGGASLLETPNGSIRTITGDAALRGNRVDFIKIDTEGFEIKVLEGLRETIKLWRPPLYVEVDNNNIDTFNSFIDSISYKIEAHSRRYPENENFIALPL